MIQSPFFMKEEPNSVECLDIGPTVCVVRPWQGYFRHVSDGLHDLPCMRSLPYAQPERRSKTLKDDRDQDKGHNGHGRCRVHQVWGGWPHRQRQVAERICGPFVTL